MDLATGRIVDTSDTQFAAKLDAKFSRIVALHSTLLNMVPPSPPLRREGSFRFSVADVWAEFADLALRGEWHLRAPAATVEGLAGPFHGYGDCLAPVFIEGHLDWYDPMLPAQDGDIVLVKWDARELQGIYKRGSNKPEWLTKYPEPWPIATKLLKELGGEYWLVTNQSMIRLGRNKILGVLRRSVVGDALAYESTPASNIEPNAATDVFSATDAGPITITLTAPATQIANQVVKYAEIDVLSGDVIEVSASCRCGGSTSGTWEIYSFLFRATTGNTILASTERIYKTALVYEATPIIGTFPITSDGTFRFGVGCTIQLGNGVNNVQAIYRDINLRVTRVKR